MQGDSWRVALFGAGAFLRLFPSLAVVHRILGIFHAMCRIVFPTALCEVAHQNTSVNIPKHGVYHESSVGVRVGVGEPTFFFGGNNWTGKISLSLSSKR